MQSVVERRNTIPILSNVLLEAADGTLALTATDMDLDDRREGGGRRSRSRARPRSPAHTLYDIVRKLPDGAQVELETAGEGGQVTLRSGRSRFTLRCLPREDFPVMAGGELPHQFPARRPAICAA